MNKQLELRTGANLVAALENKKHVRHVLYNTYHSYTGTKENNDVLKFCQYCRSVNFYDMKGLLERCDTYGYQKY
jgi:hypothetical protein